MVKEKNSTWKSLTINQVRVNELYAVKTNRVSIHRASTKIRERSLSIGYSRVEGIWVGHDIFSLILGRV